MITFGLKTFGSKARSACGPAGNDSASKIKSAVVYLTGSASGVSAKSPLPP